MKHKQPLIIMSASIGLPKVVELHHKVTIFKNEELLFPQEVINYRCKDGLTERRNLIYILQKEEKCFIVTSQIQLC